MAYWFCLNHHAVEGPEGCAYKDRLGPYDTGRGTGRPVSRVL